MKKGYEVEIKRFFDAAHQLPDSDDLITKQCSNLHGHTYYVKVWVAGTNDRHGMLVDFKGVKDVIDQLDHKFINDVFYEKNLEYTPTTAENIAKFLFDEIKKKYEDLEVEKVAVCEGWKGEQSSWAIYFNPEYGKN